MTLGFCLLATIWFALGPGAAPLARRRARRSQARRPGRIRRRLAAASGRGIRSRRRRWRCRWRCSSPPVCSPGWRTARWPSTCGFDADDTVLVEVDSALAGYDGPRTAGRPRRAGTAPARAARRRRRRRRSDRADGDDSASARRWPGPGSTCRTDARPATAEAGRAFDAPWNAVSPSTSRPWACRCWPGGPSPNSRRVLRAAAPPVAILDDVAGREALARWHGAGAADPVSRRSTAIATAYVVVGIVAPTRQRSFERELPGGSTCPWPATGPAPAFLHVRPAGRDGRSPTPSARPCARSAPGPADVQRAHVRRTHGRVDRVLGARAGQSLLLGVVRPRRRWSWRWSASTA